MSDPRRAQGKRYDLPHVLLYSVLAVASGATSYRKIEQFLQAHWQSLNEAFGSRWKRAPAYTGLRKILQGLDAAELEAALRQCLRFFGEAASEIGFDKPLGQYSEAEALQVIEAIVTAWTEAMVAHHEQAKYPPVRGLEPYETTAATSAVERV